MIDSCDVLARRSAALADRFTIVRELGAAGRGPVYVGNCSSEVRATVDGGKR